MTLTDFLLERIAADEVSARALDTEPPRWLVARVLAECEAKRRIVSEYEGEVKHATTYGFNPPQRTKGLAFALRALAVPYADHPDYREEWKP